MQDLISSLKLRFFLPTEARRALRRDRLPVPSREAPGIDAVMDAGLTWLGVAQDRSASRDGGVARHYNVVSGWGASYPETTGYIVPTCIHFARALVRPELDVRARRMLDWLVAIQMPGGGFQGGIRAVPTLFGRSRLTI